jgi:hypothetical protein
MLRRATGGLLACLCWLVLSWPAHADSTAFYYGDHLPEELLQVYERVVVEPDALRRGGTRHADMTGRRAQLFAYVSVGEVARGARPKAFDQSWVLGENHAWKSDIMDLTSPGWRRYLIEERMASLWREGYRGFFFDTLDSYLLAADAPDRAAAQAAALVSLIEDVHRRFPKVQIIVNRGFEVLPRVAKQVHGVAAESLYDRWDASTKRYAKVPEDDRQWLAARLREVRERYKLPVTVIDYRPPDQRDQARQTARRIAELGFEPWVTNADLTMLGVGAPEVVSRRVLMLYDGRREPVERSAALRLLAPILEHEGYVPVFRDAREPLPRGPLSGRYAGVVTWFSGPLEGDALRVCRWFIARLDEAVPVAVFGEMGFDIPPALLRRLGLARATRSGPAPTAEEMVIDASALVGFEARPMPHRILGPGLVARDARVRVHLRVRDIDGPLRDPVLTAWWGGLALLPHIVRQGYGGELSWVIDPFAFVREALSLQPIPAPDVTTEHGHRLLMIHVDVEGADRRAELRGAPRADEVVRALVAAHPWPHSTTAPRLAKGLAHVVLREHGMKGPGSTMTSTTPSLTRLKPYARPTSSPAGKGAAPAARPPKLSVSMPVADENGYGARTGIGFRRVIETFELGDGKRRLLPLAVFYHAYSGATAASKSALEHIYAWIEKQDTRPVYAWEYADRVREFYGVVLARELDGRAWWIHGLGALRTVRLPESMGWPDLERSPAVVSLRDLPQGRYVSFRPGGRAHLALAPDFPGKPFVQGSNAEILDLRMKSQSRGRRRIGVRARGHVPVSLTIANLPARRCTLIYAGGRVQGRAVGGDPSAAAWHFQVPARDTRDSVVDCRK